MVGDAIKSEYVIEIVVIEQDNELELVISKEPIIFVGTGLTY